MKYLRFFGYNMTQIFLHRYTPRLQFLEITLSSVFSTPGASKVPLSFLLRNGLVRVGTLSLQSNQHLLPHP